MIHSLKYSRSFLLAPLLLLIMGSLVLAKPTAQALSTAYTSYTYNCTLSQGVASDNVKEWVKTALKTMKVPLNWLIPINKTDGTSCSTNWCIWINEGQNRLGPLEFVAFHEAAHVALGHFTQRVTETVYQERAKAQEVEADLLACETLYNLGKKELIFDRLAQLQQAHNQGFHEADCTDHPTLKQNIEYLEQFLSSKGEIIA